MNNYGYNYFVDDVIMPLRIWENYGTNNRRKDHC